MHNSPYLHLRYEHCSNPDDVSRNIHTPHGSHIIVVDNNSQNPHFLVPIHDCLSFLLLLCTCNAQVLLALLHWFEGVGIGVGQRTTQEGQQLYMGYDAMCILVRLATNVQKKMTKKGIDIPVLNEFLSKAVTKFGKLLVMMTCEDAICICYTCWRGVELTRTCAMQWIPFT